MLHILLMILKILGIILASVLGIILFLLLLILFVPIRYKGNGEKTNDDMNGKVRVSWLLGTIIVWFSFENKVFSHSVKIFGITLDKYKKLFRFRREKNRISDKYDELVLEEAKSIVPDEVIETIENNNTKQPLIPEIEKISKPLFVEKLKTLMKKISEIPSKFTNTLRKIKLTIVSFCDKINYWKDFLQEESTKEAWNILTSELIKLLKHCIPKRIVGNVTYGFEDPGKTGQILAGISVFYPVYYKYINIYPDFTQNILLGDICFKGRIYIFYILKVVLKVWFNKNVQVVWNKIKK